MWVGSTSAGRDTGLFAGETRDISDALAAVGHPSLDWAGCALGGAPCSRALTTVVAGEQSTFSRLEWVLESLLGVGWCGVTL